MEVSKEIAELNDYCVGDGFRPLESGPRGTPVRSENESTAAPLEVACNLRQLTSAREKFL
jgi:hypothetical protein